MNPEEHAELAGSSELPYFLIKKLPADLIIYLGNFMQSKDYLSFIRGLWPDHDEDELVQLALWKKTTHRLRSEFMYGKPLEIEYNYDHTRIDEERVLINVYTLLPVFGGMVPPDTETFANVKRLNAFVERHVVSMSVKHIDTPAVPAIWISTLRSLVSLNHIQRTHVQTVTSTTSARSM
ncbi:repeat element 15 [Diadegma semiclausum ichnovirus]|nr:repeat element 15 [Diadegma semiclausum ichnovirus]